jgi:hypothetical protein
MKTRTLLGVATLPIICLTLLTIGSQSSYPQPLPASPLPPVDSKQDKAPPVEPPRLELPQLPSPSTSVPDVTRSAAPVQPTVEQLIVQLENLRRQRAELERQEQTVAAKLQERLKDQGERLNKLGIIPAPTVQPAKDDENIKGIFPSSPAK